jgi:hypothetical protein
MSTQLRLFNDLEETPFAQVEVEFYHVNMIMDEIRCFHSCLQCPHVRIDVLESGQLVHSCRAPFTTELQQLLDQF